MTLEESGKYNNNYIFNDIKITVDDDMKRFIENDYPMQIDYIKNIRGSGFVINSGSDCS